MKKLILAVAVVLSGCASISPAQKKAAITVGSFIAVGLVATHGSNKDAAPIALTKPTVLCHPQPDGSCR
jgi:hypothetical protein